MKLFHTALVCVALAASAAHGQVTQQMADGAKASAVTARAGFKSDFADLSATITVTNDRLTAYLDKRDLLVSQNALNQMQRSFVNTQLTNALSDLSEANDYKMSAALNDSGDGRAQDNDDQAWIAYGNGDWSGAYDHYNTAAGIWSGAGGVECTSGFSRCDSCNSHMDSVRSILGMTW